MQNYRTFEEYISQIDEPNQSACLAMVARYKDIFERAMGSTKKHQAWPGWFIDHETEIMNLAEIFYEQMNSRRRLSFSLSDALLVLFLHDIEKPWKYSGDATYIQELNSYSSYKLFLQAKVKEFWFVLTSEHQNALKYIHGEWDDYHPTIRVQWPLAAFVHCMDTLSARVWHDEPKKRGDW